MGALLDAWCGSCGSFLAWGYWMVPLAWDGPFCVAGGVGEGLWAVSKVERSTRAPRLPRFILLISLSDTFSDTLIVVSILDIVHDCHSWQLLQS